MAESGSDPVVEASAANGIDHQTIHPSAPAVSTEGEVIPEALRVSTSDSVTSDQTTDSEAMVVSSKDTVSNDHTVDSEAVVPPSKDIFTPHQMTDPEAPVVSTKESITTDQTTSSEAVVPPSKDSFFTPHQTTDPEAPTVSTEGEVIPEAPRVSTSDSVTSDQTTDSEAMVVSSKDTVINDQTVDSEAVVPPSKDIFTPHQTTDPEAPVVSTKESFTTDQTTSSEAVVVSINEQSAPDDEGIDGAVSQDQHSENLVNSSQSVAADTPKSELESAASKNATFDNNLYVKISSPDISKMCMDDPGSLQAALRGLFRTWKLESQPTCLVVPPVFNSNILADVFVLMKSNNDKTKALKSNPGTISDRTFTIKDVPCPLESVKKNCTMDDEEALDRLFPLRHVKPYSDLGAYKLGMVEKAVKTEASYERLIEAAKFKPTVGKEKFLSKQRFHNPPKIIQIAKVRIGGYQTVAVRVYLERGEENGEVVAGIKTTHADGSYSLVPIEKCEHVCKSIVELTQMFVKFMNENKELEPYDYNKKSGLICWLEVTSYYKRFGLTNRAAHMTVALPYCLKTEELLPVEDLFISTPLKTMIEDAKMTECQEFSAARQYQDMTNKLRLGSLAISAPDIFDFDFSQADSQLAAVKGHLERFRSSLVDIAKGLELKGYDEEPLSLGIDVTWHHASPCPVEWNRRSKLFYHHSGPVKSGSVHHSGARIYLDHRSRPGHPTISNWIQLMLELQHMAELPTDTLVTTCQHASVICQLVKECKFLMCVKADVEMSKLCVLEDKERKKISWFEDEYGNLDSRVGKAKKTVDVLIVWGKDDAEFKIKYGSLEFLEDLINRGLKVMVVVLDKVSVSPSSEGDTIHGQLAEISSRVFPRLVLTEVRTVDGVPGHHYVSVLLKYVRNKGLPVKKDMSLSQSKPISKKKSGGKKRKRSVDEPGSSKQEAPKVNRTDGLKAKQGVGVDGVARDTASKRTKKQQQQQQQGQQQQRLKPTVPNPVVGGGNNRKNKWGERRAQPNISINPWMHLSSRSQQQNSGVAPLRPQTSQARKVRGIEPSVKLSRQSQQNRDVAPLTQTTVNPGALQLGSQNPDVLRTIEEIVNTQTRLNELVASLTGSVGLQSALPNTQLHMTTSGANFQRCTSNVGLQHGMVATTPVRQRIIATTSAAARRGTAATSAAAQCGTAANSAAARRGTAATSDAALITESRRRGSDHHRNYNPRADWRKGTWLCQPGSSQTSGGSRKRKWNMPNDGPRTPNPNVPEEETYGPPAWGAPQPLSGHPQNQDDGPSYFQSDTKTPLKRETGGYGSSYGNESAYSQGSDMSDDERYPDDYKDYKDYGSSSNLQQSWDHARSSASYDHEGSYSYSRQGEESREFGTCQGFNSSHSAPSLAQHGTNNVSYRYGYVPNFGPSYNPAHYAGGSNWRN